MSNAVRWLPRSALEGSDVSGWISPCLADWSAAWLVTGCLEPLGGWHAENGPLPPPPAIRQECGKSGFVLRAEAGELRALAGAVLGRRLEERDISSAADHAVIDHLLQRAIDDLAQRLDAFTAALTTSGEGPMHRLEIGFENQPIMALEAPQASVTAIALALSGSPRKRAVVARRDDAIQVQCVGIAGLLGHNRLMLPDLEELGIGDVLPLMSDAGAPLDLVVGAARIPSAATLSRAGDKFLLQIERPASEWRTHPR